MYCSKLFNLVQPGNILARVDLPYKSSSIFFSQVQSVSGRLFMFSVEKASERARALLVSPRKKKSRIKQRHFGAKFLPSLTCVLSRACVIVSRQSLSKQTNNGKKFQ